MFLFCQVERQLTEEQINGKTLKCSGDVICVLIVTLQSSESFSDQNESAVIMSFTVQSFPVQNYVKRFLSSTKMVAALFPMKNSKLL